MRPVLRMFDAAATRRFYLDYLSCTLDWADGADDGPAFWQVSLGDVTLWLSSHHDDGTQGTVIVILTDDVRSLHAELGERGYRFLNPGVEEGPQPGSSELVLIDPASNGLCVYRTPAAWSWRRWRVQEDAAYPVNLSGSVFFEREAN